MKIVLIDDRDLEIAGIAEFPGQLKTSEASPQNDYFFSHIASLMLKRIPLPTSKNQAITNQLQHKGSIELQPQLCYYAMLL